MDGRRWPAPLPIRNLRCLAQEQQTPIVVSPPSKKRNCWGPSDHELRQEVAHLTHCTAHLNSEIVRLKKVISDLRRHQAKTVQEPSRGASASLNSPRRSSRRPPQRQHRPGTRAHSTVAPAATPPTPWPRGVPSDEQGHGFGRRRGSGRDHDRDYTPKSSGASSSLPLTRSQRNTRRRRIGRQRKKDAMATRIQSIARRFLARCRVPAV